MRRALLCWLAAVLLGGLAACSSSKSTAPIQEFTLRGEVLRFDSNQRIATIRHQKIEGWMEAMTMDFPVRQSENLDYLQPGKHIQATVYVQGFEFSIGKVQPQAGN